MNKPIAKSLHTVTVLVRVARLLLKHNIASSPAEGVVLALMELGLAGGEDPYTLAAAALKQLNK